MPIEIFCCYARKDQQLLQQLKSHLMPLQREGLITIWADTDIDAGSEWKEEISKHLNTAQIILLLVSPDFMDSDYCYSIEMKRAMERHESKDACVIPIILRPVYWQKAPFGRLQALPTDGKPIKSSSWGDSDEAFFNVTEGIREVVDKLVTSTKTDSHESDETKSSKEKATTTENCLRISQELMQLADRIVAFDWSTATQFRSLSEALSCKPDAEVWVASDVHRLIDPNAVIERFRKQPGENMRVKNRTVLMVKYLRNTLIFAPIVLTLYDISRAVTTYNNLLLTHPQIIRESFLSLWLQGFEGTLPEYLTLSFILTYDFALIFVILLLTALISFFFPAISEAKSSRREQEAQQLHTNIVRVLEEARHYLPLKREGRR